MVAMPWNVWNISLEKWEHTKSFKTRDQALAMGPAGDSFEVRKVHSVMEQHGTQLMRLKPSMIWRCAMDDLERRERNRKADPGEYEQYAFCRSHVAKAESANDILRAAIIQPGKGQASGKRDTRLIYSDVELLKAALR